MNYWRVGAIKVSHSPPPGTCQHNTERELPVCGIDTYPKVWEGGREKQASKLAEQTPAKAHGNAPADLPGPPHLILEKWQHWLDYNFA